jgi:hypothetical protein
MTTLRNKWPKLLLGAVSALALLASPALAKGILRLDEVPVGELDPAKASDYADSMLMFNVYDTLVWAIRARRGWTRTWRRNGRPMATATPSSCART